jgi:hypothetical protein
MADSFVKIQIEGLAEEGGEVRLIDFIDELQALKNALKVTERHIVQESNAINYRVIDLSHSSPSTVTVGITARNQVYQSAPRRISKRLTTTLSMVRRAHRYASLLDQNTLDAFQELTTPTKKHISRVVVTGERNQKVSIDRVFDRNLQVLAEPVERERDEISGRLERLNIHNTHQVDIYPLIGPPRVKCVANEDLHDDIVNNAGKWVTVDGWAIYRRGFPYPVEMKVKSIFPRESPLSLPSIIGILREVSAKPDEESAEDRIRMMRDGWDDM